MTTFNPLYLKVYNLLLNQIQSGKLKLGDKVPSEKELADQFQVSRITTKKALDLLSEENYIERIQGKGSFVIHPDAANGSALAAKPERLKRHIIGFILPSFDESYGMGLVKGIEKRCSELGFTILLKLSYGKKEIEEQAVNDFLDMGAEGLIVFPVHGEHVNNKLLELVSKNFPVVLIDRFIKGIPASFVCTDHRKAAAELTNHLFEMGHREIGFISPPSEGTTAIEERVMGFHIAHSEHGVKLNRDYILAEIKNSMPLHEMTDSQVFQKDTMILDNFLDRHRSITAIVACEHSIGEQVAAGLSRLGRRIPDEVSVVCFDSPQNSRTQFTHIKQDEQSIAIKAVNLLKEKMLDSDFAVQQIFIPHTIVEGVTTKALAMK
ncbi:GntR family transcriptional regulator [Peribacillus frigoritolerans]|uniref:GntR family transcriptional regulator n=1 Tax=Peribacillus frigoritolerans TaxID=450367 RepID=UPI0010599D6C|nr:GntR family transcriptional regulator [Peribacillus frigoritolerans]TDL83088.1 GntR family transcriptional regulator [Peribacillus frigoritolerans]